VLCEHPYSFRVKRITYNNNSNNNNSILYYLCAESIATKPITDTAQSRYKLLHYGQTQHKVKDKLQASTGGNKASMQKSKQTNK
jgi:hypothetical protein